MEEAGETKNCKEKPKYKMRIEPIRAQEYIMANLYTHANIHITMINALETMNINKDLEPKISLTLLQFCMVIKVLTV